MRIANIAKTIVIDTSGRVLLLRRSKSDNARPGQWDFPGGSVEQGESPVDAAVREASEEANLTLPLERMQLVYTATQPFEDSGASVNRFVFAIVLTNDQTPKLSHEHIEYVWVPAAEVPEVFPHPVYAVALQYAMEHKLIGF